MPSSRLFDISRPVYPGMAIYPGNPAVTFDLVQAAGAGRSALTRLSLGSHTGTHIDAPAHLTPDAATTAEYSLEQLCGECAVIDLTHIKSAIVSTDLPSTDTERLIIKTRNSRGKRNHFDPNFVALTEEAARELVGRRLKLVGIDALSIKKRGVVDQVHAILLEAGVVILEGLWLPEVSPGQYELLCLPLAVALDGAPARAALRMV